MGSKESKETYYSQKRPTTVSKETYYSVKRDLLQCQKRPTTVSKETYYNVKRDVHDVDHALHAYITSNMCTGRRCIHFHYV
jgi:hypothetical protein